MENIYIYVHVETKCYKYWHPFVHLSQRTPFEFDSRTARVDFITNAHKSAESRTPCGTYLYTFMY